MQVRRLALDLAGLSSQLMAWTVPFIPSYHPYLLKAYASLLQQFQGDAYKFVSLSCRDAWHKRLSPLSLELD